MNNIYDSHVAFGICLKFKKIPKCLRKYIYVYSNFCIIECSIKKIIDTPNDYNFEMNNLIFKYMRTYYKKIQFYDIKFTKKFRQYFNPIFISVDDFILFIKFHNGYYKYMDKLIVCYLEKNILYSHWSPKP